MATRPASTAPHGALVGEAQPALKSFPDEIRSAICIIGHPVGNMRHECSNYWIIIATKR